MHACSKEQSLTDLLAGPLNAETCPSHLGHILRVGRRQLQEPVQRVLALCRAGGRAAQLQRPASNCTLQAGLGPAPGCNGWPCA